MTDFIVTTLEIALRVAVWIIAFYAVVKIGGGTIDNHVQATGTAVGLIAAMTYRREGE